MYRLGPGRIVGVMETKAPDVLRVQLIGLPAILDPNPMLAEWRRSGPLVFGGSRMWGVTRHADVARLLKDRRTGHHLPREYLEFVMGDTPRADFQYNSILNLDPPDHTRMRRLMSKAFSRSLVAELRGWVTDLVDELLVPLRDGAPFDVVDELAFPLPTQVICELLGLADIDREEIKAQVARLTSLDQQEMNDGIVWLREYIGAALAERTPDASGDLLQRMLAAEDGSDALMHAEIVDNAALLFVAGFETTKHLIASGVAALLDHEHQRDRLLAEPAIAPTAVEEFLRYDTAVAFVTEYVHEPIEIGEHTLGEGEVVFLLLGSANRDDDVFDAPDALDIGRDPNPHLGFGGGLHLCMGAMLARLEGDIVFTRLAESMRSFDPAGNVERRGSGLGSFVQVPIVGVSR
jgi:cytochrome P450